MKRKSALVAFMTGTGNTARAAAAIAGELGQAGWDFRLEEIGRRAPAMREDDDLLVLAFPTLGFGMPGLVGKKLKRIRGRGRPAAVFSTWGGDGGAALWLAGLLLRRKGFRPVAFRGASFPFQWTQVCPAPIGDNAQAMVDEGEGAARSFGRDLSEALAEGSKTEPTERLRRLLGTVLLLPISFLYSWIGRSGLAAMYAADANCRACGTCESQCPAGAIVLAGAGAARRPRWRAACQGCNRCINLCPRRAVQVSPVRAAAHLAINAAAVAGLAIGLNSAARAAAAAAPALPGAALGLAYAAALIALLVLGSRLQFALLEPAFFALESIPAVRRTISRSWTSRFPRYRCPGFRPAGTQR